MPPLSEALSRRIRLLRRDVGNLLFHFTRGTDEPLEIWRDGEAEPRTIEGTASQILHKILDDGHLIGSPRYIYSEEPCVCFTEAPIGEFATLFALNEIAAQQDERPRYEPYGIALNKEWFFKQGGRPVIYDTTAVCDTLPADLRYRFVPFDPPSGIDHSWEREWRIRTDALRLAPVHTLVIVPTADEAAEIAYSFVDWEPESPYTVGGPIPTWLAVSLDIFGL